MPGNDPCIASAEGPGGIHEVPRAQRQRLTARDPAIGNPALDDKGDDQDQETLSEKTP